MKNPKPLEILHITDSHVCQNNNAVLKDINPYTSLCNALKFANGIIEEPDCIIATGDLSQDCSPESYHLIRNSLRPYDHINVYYLPGNHDDLAVMQETLSGGNISHVKSLDINGWHLVMLNSCSPGEVSGHLNNDELSLLDKTLEQKRDMHALICLHHQPIDINSPWLDKVGLDNKEQFLDIISRHKHVRGILWGHVHQCFDMINDGVHFMASPSTCYQFKPGAAVPLIDNLPPGFRILKLHENGTLETSIYFVE